MSALGHPNFPDNSAIQSGVWAKTTFYRIGAILGQSRAARLLADYVGYLGKAEAEIEASRAEAAALRRTLHDLRSTSGMLGFEALSDLCALILSDVAERPSSECIAHLLDVTHQSLEAARQYLNAASVLDAAA
jgi:HPt (histidine-containing phosphotransfer) domain-containing protein